MVEKRLPPVAYSRRHARLYIYTHVCICIVDHFLLLSLQQITEKTKSIYNKNSNIGISNRRKDPQEWCIHNHTRNKKRCGRIYSGVHLYTYRERDARTYIVSDVCIGREREETLEEIRHIYVTLTFLKRQNFSHE